MALRLVDRLSTIAVTATLTSAAWIVVGSFYVDRADPTGPPESPARDAAEPPPVASRAAADEEEPDRLLIPVAGISASQIGDTFNDDRGDGERRHEALDIMAPAGTPVLAAARGTIEKLFRSGEGGNTVYVRSPDRRTLYYYAHLQSYAPGLGEGQVVDRGERLGTVGATGNADPAAPHLHFAIARIAADAEWWESGRAVNPYPMLEAPS